MGVIGLRELVQRRDDLRARPRSRQDVEDLELEAVRTGAREALQRLPDRGWTGDDPMVRRDRMIEGVDPFTKLGIGYCTVCVTIE